MLNTNRARVSKISGVWYLHGENFLSDSNNLLGFRNERDKLECSLRRVSESFGELATTNPTLAIESPFAVRYEKSDEGNLQ